MMNSSDSILGTQLPIVQAPMAGCSGVELAIAVCRSGGLGSLPCALLSAEQVSAQIKSLQEQTTRPFNVNFFCHQPPDISEEQTSRWHALIAPYFTEQGLPIPCETPEPTRQPFADEMCGVIEETRPAIVSFHFGLPEHSLLERVKRAGCRVMSSATTVQEAVWLEQHGCDLIIAQGLEAGGHRGVFLTNDPAVSMATQTGLFSLLPRIADRVTVPVIATGGISDTRGVTAAFVLGASAVQVGTAFLFTRESLTSELHQKALLETDDGNTALTNLFSGRPARSIRNRLMHEIGPMHPDAAPFPLAGNEISRLKLAAELNGKSDFSSLWAGQSVCLAKRYAGQPAGKLLHDLAKGLLETQTNSG